MYVVLAGGVGAARFLLGLTDVVNPSQVTVIANTGDDKEFFGLHVSPDIDINIYTLAGVVNPDTGWGIAGDTFTVLETLKRYGNDTWFALGDQDLATHIHRSWKLKQGYSLSQVTAELADCFGIKLKLLPMSDDPIATFIHTPAGEMHFQDYLVKRQARDPVLGVVYKGIHKARPAPGVVEAIERAEAIIIPPSNPIVSVGTILAVPGIREAIQRSQAPVVGVSPIIAGKTVKGPADRLMSGLGYEVSAYGVARYYRGLLNGYVIDHQDRHLVEAIRSLNISVEVADTMMDQPSRRRHLAEVVIGLARRLSR